MFQVRRNGFRLRFGRTVLWAAFLLVGCRIHDNPHSAHYSPTLGHAVMGAAMTGDLALLRKLDARGANLNCQDPQARNWSPLIAAIYHQQTTIVGYLLSRNVIFIPGFRADALVGESGGALLAVRVSALQPA